MYILYSSPWLVACQYKDLVETLMVDMFCWILYASFK